MAKTIEAVYENGVFRPLEPLQLEEGQRVQVYVPYVPRKVTPEQIEQEIREIHEASAELTDEDWKEIEEAWRRD